MSSELEAKDYPSYDVTDVLYFKKKQKLSFFYVPSGTTNAYIVEFKAFLTAFDDTYQSQWTPNSVYGRMDPISTFENTVRKISVSFAVPAYDNADAKNNLGSISSLINMLYPVYSKQTGDASQISGAPLIRMKFGNLICRAGRGQQNVTTGGLLGYLEGINFTPNIEAGFHDPGLVGELYPMEFTINCIFNVFHEHSLGFIKEGNGVKQTEEKFPYNQGRSSGERQGITKPTIHTQATEECDEANYASALGITTSKKCTNSSVVTPEGSFRDSVVGQIFSAVEDIL